MIKLELEEMLEECLDAVEVELSERVYGETLAVRTAMKKSKIRSSYPGNDQNLQWLDILLGDDVDPVFFRRYARGTVFSIEYEPLASGIPEDKFILVYEEEADRVIESGWAYSEYIEITYENAHAQLSCYKQEGSIYRIDCFRLEEEWNEDVGKVSDFLNRLGIIEAEKTVYVSLDDLRDAFTDLFKDEPTDS